jgi:replicative DNA helicase
MVQVADEVRRARPDRIPPHNLEAEASVLGAMMLSADAIASVIDVVKADEFYRRANATTFEALLQLYARGEPVDAITAVEELKRRGQLVEVGGALRIQELVEAVPSPASAAHYAKIVSELALLRRLISAAADVMEIAYAVPENPREAAELAEGRIYAASRHEDETSLIALQPVISSAIDEIEHIQQRESALAGLATGFRDIDELLSGMQDSNFIIIAARPGAGKSALAVNIARNVAVSERKTVALFSLEMSRWELGMRLLCSEAGVPMAKVRAGKIGGADFSAFADAADTLHDAPLYIVDSGEVTILDIRAKARRLRSREELSLIVVDYLQLMSHHRRVDNRQQEIAEISRSLKLLAKELKIPVVALSQLNRDPERREGAKPQLSNLRECVTGDTTVALADGGSARIGDLVGNAPRVLALSREGRMVVARAERIWSVGVRPVFHVVLASGRRLRATDLHLVYGARGWIRVRDLVAGDRIGVHAASPEPVAAGAVGSRLHRSASSTAPSAGRAEPLGPRSVRPERPVRPELTWDPVIAVERAGREEVFDLTVPGPNSWVSNGMVSHNSGALEQDADVVMFIHREKDEDGHWVKGEAELIVAKHRNGPTGTIKLAFSDELIRFRNLYRG